jgi:hypothetical protein
MIKLIMISEIILKIKKEILDQVSIKRVLNVRRKLGK